MWEVVMTQQKATLSMPDDLKRQARAKAILEGRSLSGVVRQLLRMWLADEVELAPPAGSEESDEE
jgi:plasmid stability protein